MKYLIILLICVGCQVCPEQQTIFIKEKQDTLKIKFIELDTFIKRDTLILKDSATLYFDTLLIYKFDTIRIKNKIKKIDSERVSSDFEIIKKENIDTAISQKIEQPLFPKVNNDYTVPIMLIIIAVGLGLAIFYYLYKKGQK